MTRNCIQAWAVPGVAFAHPGSEIGRAGVVERDKLAADHDPASIDVVRERLRAGRSVLATVSGPNGPLASGSYQHAGGVAEITGIGVLPASRRRGLGAPSRTRSPRTPWPVTRRPCSSPPPTPAPPASTRAWASARSARP